MSVYLVIGTYAYVDDGTCPSLPLGLPPLGSIGDCCFVLGHGAMAFSKLDKQLKQWP